MRTIPGVLAAMILAVAAMAAPASAQADVNVTITGPQIVVPEPEFLVPVPGSADVYYYAAPEADVFFYDGWWWMAHEGRWFRAGGWNGPWVFVAPRYVPRYFHGFGPDFRHRHWHRDRFVPWGEWRARHYRPAAPPPSYVPRHYYERDRRAPPHRVERQVRGDRHERRDHDRWEKRDKRERKHDKRDKPRGRGHEKGRGEGHQKHGGRGR